MEEEEEVRERERVKQRNDRGREVKRRGHSCRAEISNL